MTTIGLSYSLVKRSTKCAPALPDTGVQERVHLGPGDYINIPAHLQHRVEWTHPTETTVWLCIYY